ncbi:MAG: polysaccharide deacetylase family protein [Actinomycetota bacterium]|nr:polysaccharide deacetylase family protein [Actinomycetota bacterium]
MYFAWSTDKEVWRPIAVVAPVPQKSSAQWDTRGYNGKAWVRATAREGLETASDRVRVRVHNGSPSVRIKTSHRAFSPNGDGRKDHVVIQVSTDKDGEVSLKAIGPKGKVFRRWHRRSRDGHVRRIHWKGRSGAGRRVPDHRYRLKAVVTDEIGLKDRESTSVVVDTKPPSVKWRGFGPRRTSGRERLNMRFLPRDRSRHLRISAVIGDGVGPVASSKIFRVETHRTTLRYAPRSGKGKLLRPGTYFARLRAQDDAGNVMLSRPQAWLVYRNVGARVWSRVPNRNRGVALTFDDCYQGDAWSRILRALTRFNAHGSFFCLGTEVRSHPGLARATVAQGHTPASHGWDHAWLSGRSTSDVAWRLRKDRKAWWRVAGVSSVPFFRPPYGANSSSVRAGAAETSHFRIIMWDVDVGDYRNPSPWYIASHVLSRVRPGSIVVMHVRNNTASALPAILRGFRDRSLKAMSLAELFRSR